MVAGSIILPGAVIMANDGLSDVVLSRLVSQLHIDETITGSEFDLRLAADPEYARNIRILQQRLLVLRSHLDTTNREVMDVVVYIKNAMVSVSCNCFGPPGKTYQLKNLNWGQLCIYHTVPDRTCRTGRTCSCSSGCSCGCYTDGYFDGYDLDAPYYPARFDPAYPQENHWYAQQNRYPSIFGSNCNNTDATLCAVYYTVNGRINRGTGCRCVKK